MPTTINKVTLLGNVGQAPRWGTLPGGRAVCNVVLATDDIEEDWHSGQSQKVTHWHRVVLVGELALAARKRLAKGDALYVEGRMQNRRWVDRHGITRYTTEVIADRMDIHQRVVRTAGVTMDASLLSWIADYDATATALAREEVASRARETKINYSLQGRRMAV